MGHPSIRNKTLLSPCNFIKSFADTSTSHGPFKTVSFQIVKGSWQGLTETLTVKANYQEVTCILGGLCCAD